jgi:hypothetical protein
MEVRLRQGLTNLNAGSSSGLQSPIVSVRTTRNIPRTAGGRIRCAQTGPRIRGYCDACKVVAMRHANGQLDMTDATEEPLCEAIDVVGAHRMKQSAFAKAGLSLLRRCRVMTDHGFRVTDIRHPIA